MKVRIQVQVKHGWAFWLFTFCLVSVVATPFSLFGMVLVDDSPFWMWQFIFMFFAGLLIVERT